MTEDMIIKTDAVYLLYLFVPFWRVTKSHEYTVGQNGTHDDHAE